MKKSIFLPATILLVSAFTMVQAGNNINSGKEPTAAKTELKAARKALREIQSNGVTTMTQNSFYADFGNVSDLAWSKSEDFSEAIFTKDGEKMTAFYDANANLVGTTAIKAFTDIPFKGQVNLISKFKDYNVGPVIYFNDHQACATEQRVFGSRLNEENNYFIQLSKDNEKIIVRVNPRGDVSLFKHH
jgi:hypothetical protein